MQNKLWKQTLCLGAQLCLLHGLWAVEPLDVVILEEESDGRSDEEPSFFSQDVAEPLHLIELSLEELMDIKVVTSSRREELMDDAPNVMRVFTREDIARGGYKTLKDLLQTVPGMAVFHRDLQFVTQVRGIAPNDNEKVAFMLNGQLLNQVAEPEVLVGPIHLGLFNRIEVIVGPGAVLYGDETLTAIVNLITEPQEGIDVTLGGGSDGGTRATAHAGMEKGDANFSLGFSWMQRDGWDAWPIYSTRPTLTGTELTGQLDPSTFLFFRAQQGDWEAQYTSIQSEFPELAASTNNPSRQDQKHYDYLDLFQFSHTEHWRADLKGQLTGKYERKRMVRQGQAVESQDLFQNSFRLEYKVDYWLLGHDLQGGIQMGYHQNRHNLNYVVDSNNPTFANNRILPLTINDDTNTFGLFIQDRMVLTRQLNLVLSGRADLNTMVSDSKIKVSPRVALIYRPVREWIHKLIYNESNRAPSPWASQLNKSWNPSVDPWFSNEPADRHENLKALEWQSIHYFKTSRIALNLYYQELEGFITWFRPFTNAGDFEGWGGELEWEHKLGSGLRYKASLSYSENEFTQTANPAPTPITAAPNGDMVGVPRWMAYTGIDWTLQENLNLHLDLRYFTRQPTYFRDRSQWGFTDDYVTMDLTLLAYHFLRDDVTATLKATNLLDNDDQVSAQFRSESYVPRGRVVELDFGIRL